MILSPAHKIYLDMQYHTATPIGQHWAAYVDVPDAYQWDPATVIPGEENVAADPVAVAAPVQPAVV